MHRFTTQFVVLFAQMRGEECGVACDRSTSVQRRRVADCGHRCVSPALLFTVCVLSIMGVMGSDGVTASSPAAVTLYVSGAAGSDSAGCGVVAASPCATLRYAVQTAAPSVCAQSACTPLEVVLASGHYGRSSCGVTSPYALSITGQGAQVTVIDCELSGRLLLTSHNVSVMGLTVLRGAVWDGTGGGAVALVSSSLSSNISYVSMHVSDAVFVNCSAVEGHGGALLVNLTSNVSVVGTSVVVQGCVLTGNSVRSDSNSTVGECVCVLCAVMRGRRCVSGPLLCIGRRLCDCCADGR